MYFAVCVLKGKHYQVDAKRIYTTSRVAHKHAGHGETVQMLTWPQLVTELVKLGFEVEVKNLQIHEE